MSIYLNWLLGCVLAFSPACQGKPSTEVNYPEGLMAGMGSFDISPSPAESEALLRNIRKQLDRTERAEDTAEGDLDDELDEREDMLEFAERWLSHTLDGAPSEYERVSTTLQCSRILHAASRADSGLYTPNSIAKGINLLTTGIFAHDLPTVDAEDQHKAVGIDQARKESDYLYTPKSERFMTDHELAKLSPLEIARLDVGEQHPGWNRESDPPKPPSARLKAFITELEEGLTRCLREEEDLPDDWTWDLKTSRRILILEDIYKSATSAKGVAEDAYGVEWKLKWGDEVHSEPVASRLYLMLGAKAADLSFTGGGKDDPMLLILSAPGSYVRGEVVEDAERFPETPQQLIETLDDFYGFDLSPYILEHGQITEANVDKLATYLPAHTDDDYQPEELIGRHWVRFREYSIEIKPQAFILRRDGSTLSDPIAQRDRAARGLYLFSLWITNRDGKDDNNKAYYLRTGTDEDGECQIAEYREGMHDLGLSFGTTSRAAELNAMTTGEDFLSSSLFGGSVESQEAFIFIPESWQRVTWSDSRWMAEKIARLSVADIKFAVSATAWPDFMQEAFVYKLVDRRNTIARLFGCADLLDARRQSAPNKFVELGGPEQIRRAEQHYGLEEGSLLQALSARNVPSGYREKVLDAGQIASPRDSTLIHQLVRQHHPSGLYSRYSRKDKQHPLGLRL